MPQQNGQENRNVMQMPKGPLKGFQTSPHVISFMSQLKIKAQYWSCGKTHAKND
jgi:hypothetical protein